MANAQDFTAFFKDAPFTLDTKAANDAFKTWAAFNERFSGIAVEAASKSNEIVAASVKETLALLRTVTTVQDAPADYAKVVSDFGTKQGELTTKQFEALGDVAKRAQSDVTELLVTTGKKAAEEGTNAVNTATTKAKAAASKTAKAA